MTHNELLVARREDPLHAAKAAQSITELLSRKFRAVHYRWEQRQPLASLLTSEDGPTITAGKLQGDQGHCRFILGLVAKFEICLLTSLGND
jgi:hypothetical protein